MGLRLLGSSKLCRHCEADCLQSASKQSLRMAVKTPVIVETACRHYANHIVHDSMRRGAEIASYRSASRPARNDGLIY